MATAASGAPRSARRKAKKPAAKVAAAKTKARRKPKQREKPKMADKDKDLPHSDKKSGPGATPGKPEKDPKDLPETLGVGKDPAEEREKNSPPPDKQPHTPNTIHNRDQDPDHPANKTPAYAGDATPRPVAEGVTVPPEELLTEQEKAAVGSGPAGDETAGVGPVSPSAHTTGPVETIEDQGIGPRTPYPTGNPPPPSESTSLSQGIWRGDETEAEARGPNARKGPVDPRPQPRIGGAQEVATPPKGSAA